MKKLIITCSILFTTLSFAQDKKWSLEECVDYALENNISVQQAQNTLLINEQDVKAAKGNFLPSLGAGANHNLSIGNAQIYAGAFVDRTDHRTNLNIRANQTIFNGFRNLNLKKQSILNLETNEYDLARIKDDISLNVVNAYLNVLFNKENIATAQAQYDFSEKQLNQVQELVDAGVQPKANVYDAEATLASDKQAITTAQNNYDLALLSLSQLLQLPYKGFDVAIMDVDMPSSTLLYNNVAPILNYAYENRSEIKLSEKNIENARIATEISKSGFYPSLTGSYSYGSSTFYSSSTDDEASFIDQIDDQKAHQFALSLDIPIFSRFANKTAVAKSKIQEENAQLNYEQQKLNLESDIQRAFADAKAAFNSYEAANESLEAQMLAFNNSKERYDIGAMSTYDLEQARVRLINAKNSLTNAKYDFVFKTKVLDFYAGKSLID
jgi:outer membrane protein